MMWSLKNEGQLKEFLQLQNSKVKYVKMLQENEEEPDKNQNNLCNSEDYKTLVQTNEETLKMRTEIVAKMNELLKPSGDTSKYREVHPMEGVMARARAEWQAQPVKSCYTSSEKVHYDTYAATN